MKKIIIITILSLFILPVCVHAAKVPATLIELLEVEASPENFFSLDRSYWSYTLYTDKDTANIKVTPKAGVQITGAGEVPIQEGHNKIDITATSEDGTTENYTINLSVVKTVGENGELINPPTGANVPILSIGILLLIGSILLMLTKNNVIYKI